MSTTPTKFDGGGSTAPIAAMRLDAAVSIAAKEADALAGAPIPVSMLARSAKPIDHWFWGVLVHDMTGMAQSKPTLPIDYCHDSKEVLGYADKVAASNDGLTMSGVLVPFEEKDRVAEVTHKSAQGVPYEASINFAGDGTVIEYVPEGMSSPVNGYQFEGPGVIVRKWTLRGVAICPYGADQNTTTNLSDAGAADVKFQLTSPAAAGKDNPMNGTDAAKPPVTTDVTPPTEEVKPKADATTQVVTPPADAAVLAAAGKGAEKFITAFGDRGARLFCEGASFEDATAKYLAEVKASHATELSAKDATISALTQKVEAANQLAGNDPLPPRHENPAPVDPRKAKLAKNLTAGTAAFAAGLRLPGAAAAATN